MTATTYTAELGTVTPRGKVHLVLFGNAKPSCDPRERVTTTVATIDGAGLEATIATIVADKIRPSRLCAHCFYVTTRKAVAVAYKNA